MLYQENFNLDFQDSIIRKPAYQELSSMIALNSAANVVPWFLERLGPIDSVVDFGCGSGAWLLLFKQLAGAKIKGFDKTKFGSQFFCLEANEFYQTDISDGSLPKSKYSIALCLDVVPLLDENRLKNFFENLTNSSDVILFSSANPSRNGVFFSNAKWQSYWINIFATYGYVASTIFRDEFWSDARVDWRYVQDGFVFVRGDAIDRYPALKPINPETRSVVDVVHPKCSSMNFSLLEGANKRELEICQLIEQDFMGYNLLKVADNSYLALPCAYGEFDRDLMLFGKYKNLPHSDSIGMLKSLLEAGPSFNSSIAANSEISSFEIVETFLGFNLVALPTAKFLAFPTNLMPFSKAKFFEGTYDECLQADHLFELKNILVADRLNSG